MVKGIYRTFWDRKNETFGVVDGSMTNDGNICSIRWTNSFVEISSFFERNAREHESSFVLFTGNDIGSDVPTEPIAKYNWLRNHEDNFVVNTLDGIDSNATGINST